MQNNGAQPKPTVEAPKQSNDIFSLDLFGGSPAKPTEAKVAPVAQAQVTPSMDLFGGDLMGGNSNPAPVQPSAKKISEDKDDFEFDDFADDSSPQHSPARKNVVNFLAFTTDHIDITFDCEKDQNDNNKTLIQAMYMNKTNEMVTDIRPQVAAAKHLKMDLAKLEVNGKNLEKDPLMANSAAIQKIEIYNEMTGKKSIALKMKLSYKVNGMENSKDATIKNFPPDY